MRFLKGAGSVLLAVVLALAWKPLPVVRVNIMLPTKRAKGVFGSYLRIYYDACPPGVVYTNDERVLGWKKKEGQ